MEPGEAFEDSVKRELWEEAGVKVWDIKYHSSQPWVSEHTPPQLVIIILIHRRISPNSPSQQTSWSAFMPLLAILRCSGLT